MSSTDASFLQSSSTDEQLTLSSTTESSPQSSSSTRKETSDSFDATSTTEFIEAFETSTVVDVFVSTDLSSKSSSTVVSVETIKTTEASQPDMTTTEGLIETATQSSTESQATSPTSGIFKPTTPTTLSAEFFTTTPTDGTFNNDTDCKNLRCYNSGSCVLTSEGPKCVCRFDRQDPNCRTLIRIKNAAFAGDSYLSHLIYSDSHRDFDVKPLDNILPINVELKARTRATDGLIMLAIAHGSKGGHYTALFLHKGLLQFQFSCGLQTMLLSELEAPINTGHEFTVQVALDFSRNHSHCNASLRINDTLAMSGDQPTWLGLKNLGKSKTVNSVWLHLGGSPQTPVVLMSELPGGQGFTGCLHSLKINENYKEIFRFEHCSLK